MSIPENVQKVEEFYAKMVDAIGSKMASQIKASESSRWTKCLAGNYVVKEKHFPLYNFYHVVDLKAPRILSRLNYLRLEETSNYSKNNTAFLYMCAFRLNNLFNYYISRLTEETMKYIGNHNTCELASTSSFNIVMKPVIYYLEEERPKMIGKQLKGEKNAEHIVTIRGLNRLLSSADDTFTQQLLSMSRKYATNKKLSTGLDFVPMYKFTPAEDLFPAYYKNLHSVYHDKRHEIIKKREAARWSTFKNEKCDWTLHDYLCFDLDDWYYLNIFAQDPDSIKEINFVCETRLSRMWDYFAMQEECFLLDEDYNKLIESSSESFYEYAGKLIKKEMSYEELIKLNPLFCQLSNYIQRFLESYKFSVKKENINNGGPESDLFF